LLDHRFAGFPQKALSKRDIRILSKVTNAELARRRIPPVPRGLPLCRTKEERVAPGGMDAHKELTGSEAVDGKLARVEVRRRKWRRTRSVRRLWSTAGAHAPCSP
jgi:hypothetical protein